MVELSFKIMDGLESFECFKRNVGFELFLSDWSVLSTDQSGPFLLILPESETISTAAWYVIKG